MLRQDDIVAFGGKQHFMWRFREVNLSSRLDEAGSHWVAAKWTGHLFSSI